MKAFLLNLLSFGLYEQAVLAPKYFVTPGSLIFDRMIDFHDFVMIFLVFILAIFTWFLVWSIILYHYYRYVFFFILIINLISALVQISKEGDIFETRTILEQAEKFKKEFFFYFMKRNYKSDEELKKLFFNIYNLLSFMSHKDFNMEIRRKVHAPWLEIFWTVTPSFILLFIAVPSLYLLYMMDAVEPLSFAIKVIGHQWYWSYEIGNSSPLFRSISKAVHTSFDSYMVPDDVSNLRLLQADNVLFVPSGIPLTFLVTSTDVIHSWAVPSLGIKVDAIPGRLNQVCVTVFDVNYHYGQCSELCGVNHGFMPINVVSVVDRLSIKK